MWVEEGWTGEGSRYKKEGTALALDETMSCLTRAGRLLHPRRLCGSCIAQER